MGNMPSKQNLYLQKYRKNNPSKYKEQNKRGAERIKLKNAERKKDKAVKEMIQELEA